MLRLLQFVVILLIGAAGLLYLLLENPNEFKQEISDAVSANTPYELKINGDLAWRYWPPVAIEISDVSLLASDSEPLATFDRLEIDVDLVPVLTRQYLKDINLISLKGGIVNIVTDANGDNWQRPQMGDTAASQDDSPPPPAIHELSVEDITINYTTDGTRYTSVVDSLRTSRLAIDTPFDFSAAIQISISEPEAKNELGLGVSGSAIYQSTDRLRFDDVTANIKFNQYPTINLVTAGEYHAERDVVVLNRANVTFESLLASLTGIVKLGTSPRIDGELTLEAATLAPVASALDMDLPGSSLQLVTGIAAEPPLILLSAMKGRFDSTDFSGNLDIALAERMALGGDLRLDKLNTASYESTGAAGETTAKVSSDADPTVLPPELANNDLDLILRVDELTTADNTFKALKVEVDNDREQMQLVANTQVFDGKLVANINTQWQETPSTAVSVSMDRLNIAEIGDIALVTGTLTGNADLYFDGNRLSQLEQNMTGRSTYNITDGTLDVRPIKNLAAIIDSLRGKQSRISTWPDVMPFETMTAQHVFQDGTGSGQILNARVENLQVTALGGFNLTDGGIDYRVTAMFEQGDRGAFTVSDDLAGIRWPMHCQGTLSESPADLCFGQESAIQDLVADIAKQQLKRKGNEKLEELIDEKVPEELKEVTRKLLEGLFN